MTLQRGLAPLAAGALDGWWYVRLYPGGAQALDDAVDQVLAPFVAALDGPPVRWFFLRYTDLCGPHLRLRVHGPRAALDACARREGQLRRALSGLGGRRSLPTVVPLDGRLLAGRHVGVQGAVYEPEHGKYGGEAGVRLAEELFQVSSELALRGNGLPRLPDRAALAVLLLRAGLTATLRAAPSAVTPQRFWDTHLGWWTLGADEAQRQEVLDAADADEHGIAATAARLADSPAVAGLVDRWQCAVEDHQRAALAHDVPRSPAHLLFHQNHMMVNRLGLLPREEAVLGRLVTVLGTPTRPVRPVHAPPAPSVPAPLDTRRHR